MNRPDDIQWWTRQLRERWGIDGALDALDGELDLNFRVRSGPGAIFKVMRQGCTREFVDLQTAVVSTLQGGLPDRDEPKSARHLPVPEIIPASDGELFAVLKDSDAQDRFAWVMSAIPGKPYANIRPQSYNLIETIGDALGYLDRRLQSFNHPGIDRSIKWNLCDPLWARDHLALIGNPVKRAQLQSILDTFEACCAPELKKLPTQAIHNDLNDYNILCRTNPDGTQDLTGIIDFGDIIRAPAICDLAIAGAYILLDQPEPIEALARLTAGFHAGRPLSEDEVALIWPLALTRLAVSALNAADMQHTNPDDPYVMISQAPIDRFLTRLPSLNGAYIAARLREAAGHEPVQAAACVSDWLARNTKRIGPVFKTSLSAADIVDLSVAGHDAPQDPLHLDIEELISTISACTVGGRPVLGRYGEPRLIYTAPEFFAGAHPATNRRTVHMAIDVFLPAGTPVHAPLDGTVHSIEVCAEHLGYGGVLTLRHESNNKTPFFTLYGHLAHDVATRHRAGDAVAGGDEIALLGRPEENGGWPPHVHLQLGLFDAPGADWPGVCDPDEWDLWQHLCPDPAILLGLEPGHATMPELDKVELVLRRGETTAANIKLSYRDPITIVRGWRNTLFDDRGRPYLDAFNNIPHVGHAHPRMTSALNRQMRLVNTNSRYLQPVHEAYIDALTSRLPEPLNVCFLLNSASEANELALRLSRNFTGARDTIVSAAGYHGNTCAAIEISDYKFSGPGGGGREDWVHVVPNPDTYRGQWTGDEPDAGEKYASYVADVIAQLAAKGCKPAAFISEPFPSVGGQIVPPPGYLKAVYGHIRAAGGLCVADEVQTGLGRLGRYQWGFAQQGVIPDMVVLGKPIGNGYPLAAVITTREIADAFANGMEFFSSFGGSTLACAVGLEVLSILDDEKLAENAAMVGEALLDGLRDHAKNAPAIGDVRGLGFFIGVEMIEADGNQSRRKAAHVVNRLRERRILIGSDGPHDNVLKIRPPLCFSMADADYFLEAIGVILAEDAIQET